MPRIPKIIKRSGGGGGGASSGAAGGVLAGTYPDPTFAADMATQAELDTHTADSTAVHGIADTSALAIKGAIAVGDLAFDPATQAELDAAKVYRRPYRRDHGWHQCSLRNNRRHPAVLRGRAFRKDSEDRRSSLRDRSWHLSHCETPEERSRHRGVQRCQRSGRDNYGCFNHAWNSPSVASADLLQVIVTAVSGSPENLTVTIVIEVT
jgi:hypothetical protein